MTSFPRGPYVPKGAGMVSLDPIIALRESAIERRRRRNRNRFFWTLNGIFWASAIAAAILGHQQ